MSREAEVQERLLQRRAKLTRPDGKREFGYLKSIVHAEFPNTIHDANAYKKEMARVRLNLKRADKEHAGRDSQTKKTLSVERLRYLKKVSLRRRGDPGKVDYAPELHLMVFHWVVDTINNVKGRISSDVLKVYVQMFAQDLRQHYNNEVARGRMDVASIPRIPKLSTDASMKSWIYRFRKKHKLAWNAVNLHLKCSIPQAYARAGAFFFNLYVIRWLHYFLNGNRQILRFDDSDEKPFWFYTTREGLKVPGVPVLGLTSRPQFILKKWMLEKWGPFLMVQAKARGQVPGERSQGRGSRDQRQIAVPFQCLAFVLSGRA